MNLFTYALLTINFGFIHLFLILLCLSSLQGLLPLFLLVDSELCVIPFAYITVNNIDQMVIV